MELELNKLDGLVPRNDQEMARAKHSDLITLPDDIDGTNCRNCRLMRGAKRTSIGLVVGFCVHPEVDQPVTERMCCKYWDRAHSIRPWKKK